MVTDPVADVLVRIKNANLMKRKSVLIPLSKMNQALLALLSKEGYVGAFAQKGKSRMFEVELAYKDGKPAVSAHKRISKPSRRMYLGVRDLKPVRRGHGLLVLSTPKGLMSGRDAKRERVGGEALFELW